MASRTKNPRRQMSKSSTVRSATMAGETGNVDRGSKPSFGGGGGGNRVQNSPMRGDVSKP